MLTVPGVCPIACPALCLGMLCACILSEPSLGPVAGFLSGRSWGIWVAAELDVHHACFSVQSFCESSPFCRGSQKTLCHSKPSSLQLWDASFHGAIPTSGHSWQRVLGLDLEVTGAWWGLGQGSILALWFLGAKGTKLYLLILSRSMGCPKKKRAGFSVKFRHFQSFFGLFVTSNLGMLHVCVHTHTLPCHSRPQVSHL